MRNMSFMLTTYQFQNKVKDVTRRMGWKFLRKGDRLMGCEKCQGLKKGEKINRLGVIEVTQVWREPLNAMIEDPYYGTLEVMREGFGSNTPITNARQFIEMFCKHNKCKPSDEVTRIEYGYICSTCDGLGKLELERTGIEEDDKSSIWVTCRDCEGEGKIMPYV